MAEFGAAAGDDGSNAGRVSETSSFASFINFLNSTTAGWRAATGREPANGTFETFDNEKPLGKKAGAPASRLQDPRTNTSLDAAKWALRTVFWVAAFCSALFPSVIKMYETSHWFREGDPSQYDDAKDWFSNPALPFQSYFDSSKVLMRVYFFIVPYILSATCVALALALKGPSPLPRSRVDRPRRTMGTFLRRTIQFPQWMVKLHWPSRITVAELLGVMVFLTLNFMTIGVRVRRSLPRGSRKIEFLVDNDASPQGPKDPIDPVSWQAVEIWGKTLGVISILNLGWYLLLPVGRKSVLLEAMGVSWERAIRYHRWCGYYSVLVMLVHSVMYIGVWIYGDGNPYYNPEGGMAAMNMVPWYCRTHECDDGQARMLRINMYGFTTMFLILVMTVFTLPWIRRQKFEWFFYAHHLFLLVLVFVCLHYKGSILYLVPGIAVYSIDKLIGLYGYRKAEAVNTRMLSPDVVEISFRVKDGMDYRAGDYVFLNVPSVSFAQWHPYSITSAPSANGTEVFFHLKGAGAPDSWTNRVIEEAKKGSEMKVRMDGFYGVAGDVCEQLKEKDGVILVGGGIGVTPMMSLATELYTSTRTPVKLLWIARTVDEYGIFSEELKQAKNTHAHFDCRAWTTLSSYSTEERASLKNINEFRTSLRSIRAMQPPRRKGGSPFVLDQPGLTGAQNATAMALSTFFCLWALAWATKMANGEAYADTKQDFISLMELAMSTIFVFLWVLIIILVKPYVPRRFFPQKRQEGEDVPLDATTHHLTSHGLDGTTHHSSHPADATEASPSEDSPSSDYGSDEEASGQKLLLNRSSAVTEETIGCRPDIPVEFSAFADKLVREQGGPVDIAVLACGPPKMLEAINADVNLPSGVGYNGGEDKQAYFSFIEEDWEW